MPSFSLISNVQHSFSKDVNPALDLEECDFPGLLLSGIIGNESIHCCLTVIFFLRLPLLNYGFWFFIFINIVSTTIQSER